MFETQGDERGGFRFDFNATTFGFYVNDAMTSRIPFQWFPERLDVWYEISIEYSSILGRVKLYINGVLRETSSVFTTGVPLSVGSNMFISDKNDQDRRLSVLLGLFAMTEGLKADVGLGNPVDASYAAYAEFDTTATTIPDVSENGRHASFDEYRFGCDEEAEGPVSFDYHLYANTNYIKTSLDFGERMAIGYDVVGSTSVLRSLDLNSIGFDTNGGIENLQIQNVNSSEVYTFELWSHVDGEKIVDVADTCVADLAGNPNVRSNKLHWIRDTVPPVATLSSTALDDLSQEICESETTPSMCDSEKRIALDELNVVINFTEPVKHLSKDSFHLTGGKIKTLRMKSKTLYNATLDISRAQGTDSVVRSIEILSNGTTDRAGNEAESSVRLDWTVDHTPPNLISVSLAHNNVPLDGYLTNDRSFDVTLRFGEAVCCIEDTMNRFVVTPSDRFSFENVRVMDSNRTYV